MEKWFVFVFLIAIPIASCQSVWDSDDDDDEYRQPVHPPNQCKYTFTVTGEQVLSQCLTEETRSALYRIEQMVQEMRAKNEAVRTETMQIKTKYAKMVETVERLEKETESWRQIVEWPLEESSPALVPGDHEEYFLTKPSFKDCWAVLLEGHTKQGIYKIKPEGAEEAFLGYCAPDGWNVIHRRFDNSVKFQRKWDEFAAGFGSLTGEFYQGNTNIHLLTKQGHYQLKFEGHGWDGKVYEVLHNRFRIENEKNNFTFKIGKMIEGNASHAFLDLKGRSFTTIDRDNDVWWPGNCALYYGGGFWLSDCGFDLNRELCAGNGCARLGDITLKKFMIKIRPEEADVRGDNA